MLSLFGGLTAPFLLRKYAGPILIVLAGLCLLLVLYAQGQAIARQKTELARMRGIERQFERLSQDVAAAQEAQQALQARVNAADRLLAARLIEVDSKNQGKKANVKNALDNRAAGRAGGDSADLLHELAQIQQRADSAAGARSLPDADRAPAGREGEPGAL